MKTESISKIINKKSKTAVTKKIALEAFERLGNDPDINKDESNKNIYLTNIESTEEYLELIEKTKEKINGQLVNTNKKKLRKDTVDTIALFVKPSYDSMKQLTFDEQVKFLSLKNITHLNRNYSTKMKELGWNVKDFELYEDMTPEEKEEHKKNKKIMVEIVCNLKKKKNKNWKKKLII